MCSQGFSHISTGGIGYLQTVGMYAPEKRIEQHRNVIAAARKSGVQKIVYTSVQGAEENTAFSPIIQCNRQTEQDVRDSGLDWVIGRNGIYIEPDVEYIETYRGAGGISNCAGDGSCGYTTRPELAFAYARMLTEDKHKAHTNNLQGEAITQYHLAECLNGAFGTELVYTPMTVEDYRIEQVANPTNSHSRNEDQIPRAGGLGQSELVELRTVRTTGLEDHRR